MEISSVQETVTVSVRRRCRPQGHGRTSRFNQEALQSIPSIRDPWVILEQAAASRWTARTSAAARQVSSPTSSRARDDATAEVNLDGIDITDMSATGGSPVYYDFRRFEEMQISTVART